MSVDLKGIFGNRIKIDSKVRSILGVFFNQDSQEVTDYMPSYQRNYVWDDEKATYFIESIFLGTEIPPLVYYKTVTDEAIRNEVIDGRQRYQSILRFINGDLRLRKNGLQRLGEVEELVGKNFDELTPHYQNLFKETRIRVIEFRFVTEHTTEEEERLKREIFQRYNTGITPLKNFDIYRAQYYYNGLNSYLKHELQDDNFFDNLLSRVLRMEKDKLEQKAMKIRELLVLNRIPIKYYAIQKQKVIRKYFELMSDQITEEETKDVVEDFKRRLRLIGQIEQQFVEASVPYNRLLGECLYWAISIVEMEKGKDVEVDMFMLDHIVDYFKDYIEKFTTVRSSFVSILVERYECTADFFSKEYDCNFNLYLYNNENFKRANKATVLISDKPLSFDELRINKPEPTSVEVSELLLNINSDRFLIRPPYQRNEVGNRKKSSAIIESLLLGVMLPPIFVFKREDGVSEVIDGQQRLLSILGYIGKPYKDEQGREQYSKQNEYALDLKDGGILKDLHGKRFSDLKVGERNKIMSSDLWVIDIRESQNKEFDPVDMFVRLNTKPYPIAKDSFEMWNSFASRMLIDTIKDATSHNEKWFYLRKNNDRMDNENLFTTLAYFQYCYRQRGNAEGEIVPSHSLELYKIEHRINCRFRLRSDITKLMMYEDTEDFIYAINSLEFGFVRNVKTILMDDETKNNSALLAKRLDSLLNFDGSKRTQMMIYVLWILLHDLSNRKIASHQKEAFNQVKNIVAMFANSSDVEPFKEAVKAFRSEYESLESDVEFQLDEVADVLDYHDDGTKKEVEMVVDLMVNPQRRFNVQHVQGELPLQKHQIGVKLHRSGIAPRYVESILKSRWFYHFCSSSKTSTPIRRSLVHEFDIPFVDKSVQAQLSKLLTYTETATGLERDYFERILDLTVYEQVFLEQFQESHVNVLSIVEQLPDLSEEPDENKRKLIMKEEFSKQSRPDTEMALMLLRSIDLAIVRKIEEFYSV